MAQAEEGGGQKTEGERGGGEEEKEPESQTGKDVFVCLPSCLPICQSFHPSICLSV